MHLGFRPVYEGCSATSQLTISKRLRLAKQATVSANNLWHLIRPLKMAAKAKAVPTKDATGELQAGSSKSPEYQEKTRDREGGNRCGARGSQRTTTTTTAAATTAMVVLITIFIAQMLRL